MARVLCTDSKGTENIQPPPPPKPKAKPAVVKKVVNRVAKVRQVSKIFYEFEYCNRTYSGFYTRKEFIENCVKCLRHQYSFLSKNMLLERAKKIWEEKANEEGAQTVLKASKAKTAKEGPAVNTKQKKTSLDLYEDPDNFHVWSDNDDAVEPPTQLEKEQTPRKPSTNPVPQKLDFFLDELDSKLAKIDSSMVIQKYRTMLGNEFIPLDSSSPQVSAKSVPVDNKNKLTTMIELISDNDGVPPAGGEDKFKVPKKKAKLC